MIKSYILINLNNGDSVKYVRDALSACANSSGVACSYYAYSGICNDCGTYAQQCCTAGQIKCDYLNLIDNLTCSLASTAAADKTLKFPESAGATCTLVRPYSFDSTDKVSKVITVIPAISVASIKVVENETEM